MKSVYHEIVEPLDDVEAFIDYQTDRLWSLVYDNVCWSSGRLRLVIKASGKRRL